MQMWYIQERNAHVVYNALMEFGVWCFTMFSGFTPSYPVGKEDVQWIHRVVAA